MKRILLSLSALFFLFGASSSAHAQELSIPAVSADEGESVNVPVNARNLEDVGSFTLVIEYDASVLTYEGFSNEPENFSVSDNASDGELRVAAFSSTGEDPVTIQAGELINLQFTYEGGTSELALTSETEVTDIDGNQISVALSSGAVADEVSEVSLGEVDAPSVGETVTVPISVSPALSNVGAVSLAIDFDTNVLNFTGVTNNTGLDAVEGNASVENGQLKIGGFSTGGVELSGDAIVAEFTYQGGATVLSFDAGSSSITDVNGDELPVSYASGSVAGPGAALPTINLPTIGAEAGEQVLIPVQARDLSNVGSVSLDITYNPTVLSFDEGASEINADFGNVTSLNSPDPGTVRFGGTDTEGLDLESDAVVTLAFTYQGGSTALSFNTQNSEVTDTEGNALNVLFQDGRVSALASVQFDDQTSEDGRTIVVNSVNVPDGGFIAIHDSTLFQGEAAGSVIGVSGFLAAGTHTDVEIELFDVPGLNVPSDTTLPGDQVLIAMPHRDTNDNQTYDFLTTGGQEDGAYFNQEGGAVVDPAFIDVTPQVITIAEARQMEPGEEVAVEGVVTRAMGRIFRMQDPTAGIAVFRSDTDFVENQGIERGDSLRVFGTRDDFNGLQEILPDSIVTLEEDVTVPPAQDVPVSELVQNGERYESELVEVDYLVTDTEDEEFQASTSYTVTNREEEEITLRVQQESDTEIPGTDVPEAFRFEGVVGEFNGDYQLIPVRENDITEVVSSDPDPTVPEEFALRGNYPNPFHGATTISLDLPKPANVRVEVVNALGQRVKHVSAKAMSPGAEKTLQLEGVDLPSGIYLYRVVAETGDETWTRSGKMTVVK